MHSSLQNKIRQRSDCALVSLATCGTLVTRKPEVGVAGAAGVVAATRGDVDHSGLLVFHTERSTTVSLLYRMRGIRVLGKKNDVIKDR